GPLRVVICRCPEQGTAKAQTVTRHLLDDLAPRWILVVGICGAFPDSDFTLGDVVIATRVQDFCVTGAIENQLPQLDVRGGPLHPDAEKLIGYLPAHQPEIAAWALPAALKKERPTEQVPEKFTAGANFYGPPKWQEKVHQCLDLHFNKQKR